MKLHTKIKIITENLLLKKPQFLLSFIIWIIKLSIIRKIINEININSKEIELIKTTPVGRIYFISK